MCHFISFLRYLINNLKEWWQVGLSAAFSCLCKALSGQPYKICISFPLDPTGSAQHRARSRTTLALLRAANDWEKCSVTVQVPGQGIDPTSLSLSSLYNTRAAGIQFWLSLSYKCSAENYKEKVWGEGGCWATPILIFNYSTLTWFFFFFYPLAECFAASFLSILTCWVSKDHLKSHLSQDLLCAGACRADICTQKWRTGNTSLLHSLHQWCTPGGKHKSVIGQNSCLSLKYQKVIFDYHWLSWLIINDYISLYIYI